MHKLYHELCFGYETFQTCGMKINRFEAELNFSEWLKITVVLVEACRQGIGLHGLMQYGHVLN